MSDTLEYLEREVESHRANVEDSLEQLKDRLSVNRMVDDLGQLVGLQDMSGTLSGAGQKLRDHPVAVGLIGAGVAWLLLGGMPSRRGGADDRPDPVKTTQPTVMQAPSEMYGNRALDDAQTTSASGHLGAATDAANDTFHRTATRVRSGIEHGGRRKSADNAASANPLLIGALALVAGAVIGSALPRSRSEERLLGNARDRLVDEGKAVMQSARRSATRTAQGAMETARVAKERAVDTAQNVKNRAADAAHEVYAAARDKAEAEGLIPDPVGKLGEKVGKVAKTAIDEAKEQVEPMIDAAKDAAKNARKDRG